MVELRSAIQGALNRHGYGLQAALAREVRNRPGRFEVVGVEVPINVRSQDGAIDLLLGHSSGTAYLAVECKRVDPALGVWCFARNAQLNDDNHDNRVCCDVIVRDSASVVLARRGTFGHAPEFAQIGQEIANIKKGDGTGNRRDLNDAITQALRSASGWMNWLRANDDNLAIGRPTPVLAMVVTSASLCAADVDLQDSQLSNGHLDMAESPIREVEWLVLQSRLSVGIRHSVPVANQVLDVKSRILVEAGRSVLISSVRGFDSALNWLASQQVGE